ncbi:hypothetical protein [Propionimicrobium lymphophilum]|uniref:hypothetical protein n=1 Tax=Propionimicrobium lymphophilum TaxID=33012 RepID=UPI000491A85A|nr:hypothetical protein [Propionimicrobium lymphophilum]
MTKQSILEQGNDALYQAELPDVSLDKLSGKQSGALFADIIRDEFNQFIGSVGLAVVLSQPNSFVVGCGTEFDLIVMRKDAEVIEGRFFHPNEVVSLIECKAGGTYAKGASTASISKAANSAIRLNQQIRFGYVSLWENRPKNKLWLGNPTIDHRKRTEDGLKDEIKGEGGARTLFLATKTSGKIVERATNIEIEDFFLFLAGHSF